MKYFFSLTAIVLFLASCVTEDSSSVDQSRIWTNYTVEYNAAENLTKATAQFRFGNSVGTVLELSDPAEVSANGQNLIFNNVLAPYSYDFVGLVEPVAFTYSDTEGNVFNNSVNVPAPVTLPSTVTEISKSQAFLLYWEGDALGPNEIMYVYIQEQNGTDIRLSFAADTGDEYITISTSELQDLNTGPANLRLERAFVTSSLIDPGAGGRINATYKSPVYAIQIVN
ncbi:MAG: hypothetical protein ACK500_00060 [Flavobacteriales bacterium]